MRKIAGIMLLLAAPMLHAADSFSVTVMVAPAPLFITGSTTGTAAMTTRTDWNLPGWTPFTITSCIYMLDVLRGTAGNTDTVPYTSVLVTPTNGVTVPMNNQNSCRGAGAIVVGSSRAISNNGSDPATRGKNGYREDTASLQVINVGSLSPDTYTGTIYVSATWY